MATETNVLESAVNELESAGINAPKVIKVKGEITSLGNAYEGASGSKFRVLTVDSEQIIIAEKQFERNIELLRLGNNVNIDAEKRIPGVTEYVDEQGTVHTHAGSGLLAFTNVQKLSQFELAEKLMNKFGITNDADKASIVLGLLEKAQ